MNRSTAYRTSRRRLYGDFSERLIRLCLAAAVSFAVDAFGAGLLTPRQPLPTTGPFEISQSGPSIPAFSLQLFPSVATDGRDFLVTWMDDRRALGAYHPYAVRVRSDGIVQDRNAIPLGSYGWVARFSDDNSRFLTPQAFWNGSAYSFFSGLDFPVVDLARSGEVKPLLDKLVVSPVAERLRLAFNGKTYLAVWTDANHDGGFGNVLGLYLGLDGRPLGGAFNICNRAGFQLVEDVAWDGQNFHVVWSDGRDSSFRVYHAMILPTGEVQPSGGESVFPGSSSRSRIESSIACSNGRCAIVSVFPDFSMSWIQYDTSGRNLGTGKLSLNGINLAGTHATLAASTNGFWLGWISFDQGVFASRLGLDMTLLEPAPLALSRTLGLNLKLAPAGGNCLATWISRRDLNSNSPQTDWQVSAAWMGSALGSMTVKPVDVGGRISSWGRNPKSAFNGREYLCVWEVPTGPLNTGNDIYGIRLDRDGVALDQAAFPICTAAGEQSDPRLASIGEDFFVVWKDDRPDAGQVRDPSDSASFGNIYGSLVSAGGVPVTSNGFALSPSKYFQQSPSIATDGTNYLVVWEDSSRGSLGSLNKVWGLSLDPQGHALSQGAFPVGLEGIAGRPVLAGSKNGFFLVMPGRTGAPRGMRINTDGTINGTVFELNGLRLQDVQIVANDHGYLAISSRVDGVFSQPAQGYVSYFITNAGELGGPYGSTRAPAISALAIASSGEGFLTVIREAVTGDITALRFTADGGRDDILPFLIEPFNNVSATPSLSYDFGMNKFLLLREKFLDDRFGIVASLHSRIVPFEVVDGEVRLSWAAEPGQRFILQSKGNLNERDWRQVGDAMFTTNNTGSFSMPISNSVGELYLRVIRP